MCWSAMNLGKTWMGQILKNSNKMEKEDNVSIKIKHISLLKKKLMVYILLW